VITQLEPDLFKTVTGLNVRDFELLCSFGVFNASLMNDAIFKFKRYEDSSLSYTGINRHDGKDIGGWDTVIKRQEYERLFYNQQGTMTASAAQASELEDIEPTVIEPNRKMTSPAAETVYATKQYSVKPSDKSEQTPKKAMDYMVHVRKTEQEAPQMDLAWVTDGAAVAHRAFGVGSVVKTDKNKKYITIKFDAGEKRFVFPDAFIRGFLHKA